MNTENRTQSKKNNNSKNNKTNKRKLFDLHAWLGFHLALFMLLVLLTGTFAVIADEIDWLVYEQLRVSPANEKISWGEMEQAIRAYAPDDGLLWLMEGEADYFAYRALMLDKNNKAYFLYINQWAGDVTGATNTLTVQRFLRDLHRYLFLPGVIGLPLVSSLAFVLAISLYTGLKTTGKWLKVAGRLRTHKGSRVAVGDYHKAAGIWVAWFLVLIVITSLWYLFEWGGGLLGQRFEPERPGVSEQRIINYGSVIKDADADTLVAAAKAAFPGLVPTDIMYATAPQSSVIVMGRTKDILVRDRANRVFLDPVDASVIKVQKSKEIGAVAYINELADPLHFGDFGGLSTKLVWFMFGLAMCSLSFTGVWLTWKRIKSTALSRPQIATLPLLLLTMVVGYFYVQRYIGNTEFSPGRVLEASEQQGLQATLKLQAESNGQAVGKLVLDISSALGRPNVLEASLRFDGVQESISLKKPSRIGNSVLLSHQLEKPTLDASGVTAMVMLASGAEIAFYWSL